jgi:hypothetical protein
MAGHENSPWPCEIYLSLNNPAAIAASTNH